MDRQGFIQQRSGPVVLFRLNATTLVVAIGGPIYGSIVGALAARVTA